MSIAIKNKLKYLHEGWPPNTVITARSLRAKGFSDQLIQKYCQSGWLIRLGHGAFQRQYDKTVWVGGLYAIQHDLKKPIHIGGLTALEYAGLAHYLKMSSQTTIYLYNTTTTKTQLPRWFHDYFNNEGLFIYKQVQLFSKEIGLKTQLIDGLEVIVSDPERAILELLYLVPSVISFEHATQLLENLQTIRPAMMQELLESCHHILVKRLFLCLAELNDLPVIKYLDTKTINLGSGTRRIATGGQYIAQYDLVIPFDNVNEIDDIDV